MDAYYRTLTIIIGTIKDNLDVITIYVVFLFWILLFEIISLSGMNENYYIEDIHTRWKKKNGNSATENLIFGYILWNAWIFCMREPCKFYTMIISVDSNKKNVKWNKTKNIAIWLFVYVYILDIFYFIQFLWSFCVLSYNDVVCKLWRKRNQTDLYDEPTLKIII